MDNYSEIIDRSLENNKKELNKIRRLESLKALNIKGYLHAVVDSVTHDRTKLSVASHLSIEVVFALTYLAITFWIIFRI